MTAIACVVVGTAAPVRPDDRSRACLRPDGPWYHRAFLRPRCSSRYRPPTCVRQHVCEDSPIGVRFAFSGKGRDKHSRTLAQVGVAE